MKALQLLGLVKEAEAPDQPSVESDKLEVPDLGPLEQELTKHLGIRPKLTGEIVTGHRGKQRLSIDSDEMASHAGVLKKSFKTLKVRTFNSDYNDKEKTFWMTINWGFQLASGGSNGFSILTAWYDTKTKKWTFEG